MPPDSNTLASTNTTSNTSNSRNPQNLTKTTSQRLLFFWRVVAGLRGSSCVGFELFSRRTSCARSTSGCLVLLNQPPPLRCAGSDWILADWPLLRPFCVPGLELEYFGGGPISSLICWSKRFASVGSIGGVECPAAFKFLNPFSRRWFSRTTAFLVLARKSASAMSPRNYNMLEFVSMC